VSFAACVAFQRVFIVIYFVMTQSGNFWIYPRITLYHAARSTAVSFNSDFGVPKKKKKKREREREKEIHPQEFPLVSTSFSVSAGYL
jgi:hypothetical protein